MEIMLLNSANSNQVLSALLTGGCEDASVDIYLYTGDPEASSASEIQLLFLLNFSKSTTAAQF